MARLYELTKLIRSKNAGPFQLTIDIMFDTRSHYDQTRASGVLSVERFAEMYHIIPDDIKITYYDVVSTIKVTLPRLITSGDLDDSDIMGGQQYAPLVDVEIPVIS